MKLTVKNFGPIKTAEVDIKPMTVFAGPSNTGKSYLAILIYTITKTLKSPNKKALMRPFRDPFKKNDTAAGIISDDKGFTDLAGKLFFQFMENIREQWKTEALRCFGEEWENIVKQNGVSVVIATDDDRITLNLLSSAKIKPPKLDSMLAEVKKNLSSGFEKNQNFDGIEEFISPHPGFFGDFEKDELVYMVMREISRLFKFLSSKVGAIHSLHISSDRRTMLKNLNTHYLPAVRGGLMQSHRILVSSLIARAPTIGLTGAEIVPFTGVLADFLEKLIMISSEYPASSSQRPRKPHTGSISKLSKEIEKKIMHGAITMKPLPTQYPDFRYQFTDKGADKGADSREISLMHASSSVSELAPIVLFIRYYLSPRDVFIVEEPEAHLHPGAQRLIAGVLVELVNAGVQVIVTTHSDIILEQISNFIHADEIPQAEVLKRKAAGRTLSKEKAGCYLFKGTTRSGTTVQAVKFDAELGILTKDHLDVSSDLYNETVDLFNAREGNADGNM